AFHAQVPADAIEEFWRRSATLGRRIFRDAKGISRLGNDGKGNRGRLPPVVSSLFSIRAAHFKRWYQRHAAVSKGQGADGATAPRYRLSDVQATRLPLQISDQTSN